MNKFLTVLVLGLGQLNAQIITTAAGSSGIGFSGDGGYATNAQLYAPSGMAFDNKGNYYIADAQNNRIRKVDTHGIISTVVGDGFACCTLGDGGLAVSAELYLPTNIAFDAAGNMYISDSWHQRIRKVDTSGIITTIAGTGYSPTAGVGGFSGDGGRADTARLNVPAGMCFDAAGNLYFADADNHRIRKIDTSGIITTIAGTTQGYSGDGGLATVAQLNIPSDVEIDSWGNLYIADGNNNVVRMIDTSGIITTIAGTGTGGFSGDGSSASSAQLYLTYGIALDSTGNLFIADTRNNRIRKVDGTGMISTVAGTGFGAPNSGAFSGDGGSPLAAELFNPYDVVFDAKGIMYIVDVSNNRIRRVDSCGNLPSVSFSIAAGSAPHTWDIYPNYSSNVTNAKWYWGDDSTSYGLYPSHTYDSAGWYQICVTVYNICGDTIGVCQMDTVYRLNGNLSGPTVQVNVINGTTSLANNNSQIDMQVFPNPSSGIIQLRSHHALGLITISGMLGNVVLQITSNNLQELLDLSILSKGVYNIQVLDQHVKLIKE